VDLIAALAELAARYRGAELGRRLRTPLASELSQLDDSELGDLAESLLAKAQPSGPAAAHADRPPQPYYPTVQQFVQSWLLPIYRRSVRGPDKVWCPRWWEHGEAISRLDALWRAWETLRLDPGTGLSVWWRDHADHHLTILLGADGPFRGCEDGHSARPLEQLPHQPPPAGTFQRDERGLPAEPIHASLHQPYPLSASADGRNASPRTTLQR